MESDCLFHLASSINARLQATNGAVFCQPELELRESPFFQGRQHGTGTSPRHTLRFLQVKAIGLFLSIWAPVVL